MRHFTPLLHGLTAGLLLAGSALAADSPSLDPLQGKWLNNTTNREGEKVQFILDIKKDTLALEIRDADQQPLFFAKGKIKLEKTGPFDIMNLDDIEAGRAADDLRAANETRAYVYTVREDRLFLASGFDEERRREPPRADLYVRQPVQAAAAPADAGAVLGKWKIEITYNEQTREYELRLEKADGQLQGAMVSPRSGEHKLRLVTFKDNQLTMEWDREISNTPATLVFQGKLAGEKLAGTVVVKDHEDLYKGTWKATK